MQKLKTLKLYLAFQKEAHKNNLQPIVWSHPVGTIANSRIVEPRNWIYGIFLVVGYKEQVSSEEFTLAAGTKGRRLIRIRG